MDEKRIGVYICWCGSNINKMVDVIKVAADIGKLPNVVLSRDYKYMCSDPGQELLIKEIKEHNLDRIVIGACSPRIHEITFRKALEKAGLNPYMLQIANIREQDSWVHEHRDFATEKAKSLISAAVRRINHHEPLERKYVDINPATLIIGGGISGLSAAMEIAEANKQVYIIEKSNSLGGLAFQLDLSFPDFTSITNHLKVLIHKVIANKNIRVFTRVTLQKIDGYYGNFTTEFEYNNSKVELNFGNIIVATGLQPFNPIRIPEYSYKELVNVITSSELETRIIENKDLIASGKNPENIVLIHCVGSRNSNFHQYCSRICCSTALKYAHQLSAALPETNIYNLYSEMRCYGKACEELYTESSKRRITFLMFDQQQNLPEIRALDETEDGEMTIRFNELLSGERVEVVADLVILMVGLEANEDAAETGHMVGISSDEYGFYMEKHPKLDPVATTTDGVYIAGTCQGPKSIEESINQAKAASARILSVISKGKAEIEVTTAIVNEDICCGCKTCVQVCPYSAIRFNEELGVSGVNEIVCKGCGTCSSACPTGAIKTRHFTDVQIISQIDGMLEEINQ